jgi:glycosyltransferase involved in cell wall biosynthesis
MRIAYIAPYQGAELLKRRPIVRNLSLAGNTKIELIAALLRKLSHEVEIISQGEVVDSHIRHFASFREHITSSTDVPVFYASTLPIKYLNGFWSTLQTLRLFKLRHARSPFDLVIIYNLKAPQLQCARHAIQQIGLPVVVEYEDDAFVDVQGNTEPGFRIRRHLRAAARILNLASGCIGVSPYLLTKPPSSIPKMLLRGVVDDDILRAALTPTASRKNWVVYSGTHHWSKGLEPMIKAWKMAPPKGWELHIAGRGALTATLEKLAADRKDIIFHGLLGRREYVRFLESAKIALNPHELSRRPGNVFAFKIIEYLAAGAHCITTPMGSLEPDLEAGITYLPSNAPAVISSTLHRVIASGAYTHTTPSATCTLYGPTTVSRSLDTLLTLVISSKPGSRASRLTSCAPF